MDMTPDREPTAASPTPHRTRQEGTNMPAQTQVKAEIDQRIDCLLRASNDSQGRYEHARDAGAALAAVVYAFTEDPESVGTDALRSAYATFMGQHAGNFAPVG